MPIPRLNPPNVGHLTKEIQGAQSVLLTTHKQCDGDGLGACLGLYHALKKMGKDVRVMTVDAVPAKYFFLQPEIHVEVYEDDPSPLPAIDLCLIFDTNDRRLVEPLYPELEDKCRKILFIDHHPVLNEGPEPTMGSFIDTRAASTGEIAYFIIDHLGVRLDPKIARALYTSIAFDTQIFRFVKGATSSHLIAADLLEYEKSPEEIHKYLFSTYTTGKIRFLSKVLGEIEFYNNEALAVLKLRKDDLDYFHLGMDDARDVVDILMNITSVKAAALFREDSENNFKLSLRSKSQIEVLSIAESLGGGGHMYASGAPLLGPYEEFKTQVVEKLQQQLNG